MSQLVPLPITPPPGVVLTEAEHAIEGRWILPWNWFRFERGKPQKMGGWVQAFAQAVTETPHDILCWTDLMINRYLAVGTYRKLYVYDPNLALNDITPYRLTSTGIGGGSNLTNPFSCSTAAGDLVTVTQTGHGLDVGDAIYFPSVGSTIGTTITPAILEVATGFIVASVISSSQYTFHCGTAATSTTSGGGGTVTYNYEINVGTEQSTLGLGWGVGTWGTGTWGSPRSASTIIFEGRVWSLDHFGKLLMATYNSATTLYTFDPTQNEPWPRAIAAPNCAAQLTSLGTTVRSMLVTPERFVFLLCEDLIVTSSSQGDYTTWTPATANTAFTRTMTVGTKLIGGVVMAPFLTMIFSDGAAFLFQYTGDAFIYRSSLVGQDCGLIGINGAISVNGNCFWMSNSNFYMYNGAVQAIPNVEDVRKYVFDNLNIANGIMVNAGYNSTFNEVWWFLPLFGANEPNYLLIFHMDDQCWSIHPCTRVSMSHYASGDARPFLGDVSGIIYQHENGLDAAGSAITATMTLSPYSLTEGDQAMDVEGMIFETLNQVGNINLTVNTWDYIDDTSPTIEDTETEVVPSSGAARTDFRVAGRYIGWTAVINSLGSYFRLGKPTAFIRKTARRR
jgi:hypothetical protein